MGCAGAGLMPYEVPASPSEPCTSATPCTWSLVWRKSGSRKRRALLLILCLSLLTTDSSRLRKRRMLSSRSSGHS